MHRHKAGKWKMCGRSMENVENLWKITKHVGLVAKVLVWFSSFYIGALRNDPGVNLPSKRREKTRTFYPWAAGKGDSRVFC